MFIVSFASEVEVSDTSQSLIVNELTARHKLCGMLATVSFMSSIARKAVVHIFLKCFETLRPVKKKVSYNLLRKETSQIHIDTLI